jgi:hypothetical protein
MTRNRINKPLQATHFIYLQVSWSVFKQAQLRCVAKCSTECTGIQSKNQIEVKEQRAEQVEEEVTSN